MPKATVRDLRIQFATVMLERMPAPRTGQDMMLQCEAITRYVDTGVILGIDGSGDHLEPVAPTRAPARRPAPVGKSR